MSAEPTGPGALSRARAGDAGALTALYERFGQLVLDVGYRITGSPDEAEDVLQDVFLGLPEALRTYDAIGSFEGWIRRLATRTALLRLRRGRRRTRWQREAASESPAHARPDAIEARLTLQRALERMPEELRVVYVLKEVEGYPHAEIAEILGLSQGASEVRLHRARKFLRSRLKGGV